MTYRFRFKARDSNDNLFCLVVSAHNYSLVHANFMGHPLDRAFNDAAIVWFQIQDVMEVLENATLSDHLKEGRLPSQFEPLGPVAAHSRQRILQIINGRRNKFGPWEILIPEAE